MKFLVWAILGYVVYRVIKGFLDARKKDEPVAPPRVEDEAVRDPICGVYLSKEDAVIGTVEGEKVFFCSMECLNKYRDQLEQKEAAAKTIHN